MFRTLIRMRSARVALVILAVVAFLVVFGGILAPDNPVYQYGQILAGPSRAHPLGTDYVGRDVLSRLMSGTQLSVLGALEAVGIAAVLGVPVGLASAGVGRAGEWVTLRFSETLMALPGILFAIAVVGSLGNGLHQAMIAIGILMSPLFFRVTRAVALGLRRAQYVEAAELMGASQLWVLRTHIWSKVLPNVAVTAAQTMGTALLAVASLAFLGLGIAAPAPTWGGILAADLGFLQQQPWAPIFPAVLLMLTVGSLNVLADCIADATGIQRRRRRRRAPGAVSRRDRKAVRVPSPVETEEAGRVTAA